MLAMLNRRSLLIDESLINYTTALLFSYREEVKDLHTLYLDIAPKTSMSEIKRTSIQQALTSFCDALKSVGDMWMSKDEWMDKSQCITYNKMQANQLEQHALSMLNEMIKIARQRSFNLMDQDESIKACSPRTDAFEKTSSEPSYLDSKTPSGSPATPTSVLPQMTNRSRSAYSLPLLLLLRVQAIGKLNPIYVKLLSFHMFSYMANSEQINTTVEELKQEKEAKNSSEITVAGGIEVPAKLDHDELQATLDY